MYITSALHTGIHFYGNSDGGKRAANTNKERYGETFYQEIGRAGGKKSRGGGFAKNPELARRAGQKGGRISKGGGRKPSIL